MQQPTTNSYLHRPFFPDEIYSVTTQTIQPDEIEHEEEVDEQNHIVETIVEEEVEDNSFSVPVSDESEYEDKEYMGEKQSNTKQMLELCNA